MPAMRLVAVIVVVAVAIAVYVASAAPGTWPVRLAATLLLEALAVFVVAGVRRLIADSKVVDDHPEQELPLTRDRAGHVIGAAPFFMEKGLEVFAKDLIDDDIDDDRPERGSSSAH